MDSTKHIIKVFEVISHRRLQLGTGSTDDAIDLASAQLLLEPRLHGLEKQVSAVLKQCGVVDTRVASLRAAESVTSFVVGILAGLDLAGRPDIVGKFAKLYASEAKQSIDPLFNTNSH